MKYEGNGSSEKILSAAASALREWNGNGMTLDDCVEQIRKKEPGAARAASSILFEYFRHKEFLDTLLMRSVSRGIKPELKCIALCALTQALFQSAIAGESAVNIAVEIVKRSRKHRMAAGFMNAVLRSCLRAAGNGPFPPSFPPELRRRWIRELGGAEAEQAIAACGANPPLTFRLRMDALPEDLTDCRPVTFDFTEGFSFYECPSPDRLFSSPAFSDGKIYIQDPATAMSISLCRPVIRGRVLDSCAAPGGKTAMLRDACRGEAEWIAADRSSSRIENMRANLDRLHLPEIRVVEADALHPPFAAESFDLVFLDVPCSNTGVPRRRPDVLWRFSPARLREIVELQKRILEAQIHLVRPGGHLLYSTCSIEKEEDHLQIERFLSAHPECSLVSQRRLTPSGQHDGAFAALLRKQSSSSAQIRNGSGGGTED